jgi:DNA repair protein RAD50
MCSGQMPPHSNNGKTFIHDPRISEAPETKAFIKLKFTSCTGQDLFALRSYQLTNIKGGSQTFKKREQVMKIKDENGETRSISGKCTDMDR